MDESWGLVLSEISHMKKDKHYDFTHMWNLKKKKKKNFIETEKKIGGGQSWG